MTPLELLAFLAVSAVVVWLTWSAYFRGHYRRDRPAPDLSKFGPPTDNAGGPDAPGTDNAPADKGDRS